MIGARGNPYQTSTDASIRSRHTRRERSAGRRKKIRGGEEERRTRSRRKRRNRQYEKNFRFRRFRRTGRGLSQPYRHPQHPLSFVSAVFAVREEVYPNRISTLSIHRLSFPPFSPYGKRSIPTVSAPSAFTVFCFNVFRFTVFC